MGTIRLLLKSALLALLLASAGCSTHPSRANDSSCSNPLTWGFRCSTDAANDVKDGPKGGH